jgi:hypothetical protein
VKCKRCGNELSGKQVSYCSARCKNQACVTNFRRNLKLKAIAYLGGACMKCGYNKCAAALGFHHRDPSKKDFRIGSGIPKRWELVRQELAKCDLLCANCHAEEHWLEDMTG